MRLLALLRLTLASLIRRCKHHLPRIHHSRLMLTFLPASSCIFSSVPPLEGHATSSTALGSLRSSPKSVVEAKGQKELRDLPVSRKRSIHLIRSLSLELMGQPSLPARRRTMKAGFLLIISIGHRRRGLRAVEDRRAGPSSPSRDFASLVCRCQQKLYLDLR